MAGVFFFVLPTFVGIYNIGNLAGLFASVVLLFGTVLHRPLFRLLKYFWKYKAGKISLSVFGGLISLGILLCLVLSCMMLGAMHKKPQTAPDAMIVLGCKVRGNVPSLMLAHRLQAAERMLTEYPDMICVVSGGQGADEQMTEAKCMYEWLIAKGVDSDRILMEDKSASTSENLRFSKEILNTQNITDNIMLVTDGFHQLRAQYLAKKEGLDECYAASARTSWYLLPTYWVREWFGLVHAFVFGR